MPQLQKQDDFTPCPPGEHHFTLLDVEQREMDDFNDSSKKTTRLLWKFVSDTINPDSRNQEGWLFTTFTGLKYGNHKAGLTILLNQLIPGLAKRADAEDFAAQLNTDSLLGTRYFAVIRHDVTDKGDLKPVLAFIKPLEEPRTAATPPPVMPAEAAPAQPAASAPTPTPAAPPADWKTLFVETLDTLEAHGYTREEGTEMVKKNVKARDVAALDAFLGRVFYGEFDKPAPPEVPTLGGAGAGFSDPFAEGAAPAPEMAVA